MKKLQILLPLAAVLLSLTGCKKDNEKSGPSGETVTLSATLGGGEKTEINGFSMTWSDGDAVNINGTPYTATFNLGYETANFEGVDVAPKYKAIYPADIYQGGDYVLPATQEYNGNTLSKINPMYAETETTSLQFNHICALVKLQVTGTGTVKQIVVTSTDPLCGEFSVVDNGGKYHAEISGSGSTTLTLDCGTGVALDATTPTTFYIALPQGTLGDLTFKCSGDDGVWKATPIASANLTAGKLYTKKLENVEMKYVFSVDDGKTVEFAPGNLQATWNGNGYTWAFAENQYDIVGAKAGNTTIDNQTTVGAKVDLFGWTKAGMHNNDGIKQYGINTSKTGSDYGSAAGDVCCDWGSLIGVGWRPLTSSEWTYLFDTRGGAGAVRYAKATVNNVCGIILVPDDWSGTYDLNSVNNATVAFTVNTIEKTDWENILEPAGCVFLPAAGNRGGTSVNNAGITGYYWSSTPNGETNANCLSFFGMGMGSSSILRYFGFSVRLVLPVEN